MDWKKKVWVSGFPHFLKLSQRERSLQAKAMITFKRPPVLRDYLTSMQLLKIVLLRPVDIAPYVANMANITAWLKRNIISALWQEESSWANVCLVQFMGSMCPLVCFAKNNMWDKLKIRFPSDGPLIGTISISPQEKRSVLCLNITPWSTLP